MSEDAPTAAEASPERAAARVREADRRHWRMDELAFEGVRLPLKPGARLHPSPPKGWGLLVDAARAARGCVLDASASAGLAARAAGEAELHVLEPSAAGLACLSEAPPGVARVQAGLAWDAEADAFDAAILAPPAERGRARVLSELVAVRRALRPGGVAWILFHKDRGAKRHERDAARVLGALEVTGRSGGWRLSRVQRDAAEAPSEKGALAAPTGDAAHHVAHDGDAPWAHGARDGHGWWSLPGVFAAAKVDSGTKLLLDALEREGPDPRGSEALDLGCGTGLLGAWAARRGARVSALDDDLAAVRSAERTLAEASEGSQGADAPHAALHSDLDAALPEGARFDLILCNPPFHVGAGVRMDLPAAFVAAARRRLRAGGEGWWVANAALPYEDWLRAAFGTCRTVAATSAFKVLRAPG